MKVALFVIRRNHQLYQFIGRINNNRYELIFWPSIEHGERNMFHQIQEWQKILTSEESSNEIEKMKAMMF